MKIEKKIAVVILNWNGKQMMREFLPSVIKHSSEWAEVIVADNASTDSSMEMLSNEFPTVGQIQLDKNYGFAEGYNRALAQIEAEYFVLLNSDVEVDSNWLQPQLEYMEAHPDVAACQPKILAQRNKESFEYAGAAGGFLDKYGYPFCRGRIFHAVEVDNHQYDSPCDVLWATGAALFVRSKDWTESGGLDGRFFAHMEEIDLCWRLRNRGRRIVCIPQSHVYHVGGATLDQGNPRKTYLNFRNNLLMLYKNLGASELQSIMRGRTCLDYIAAFKFLASLDVKNYKAVLKARKDYQAMRPEFEPQRLENLRLTTTTPKERTNFSILWKFYVCGNKTFDKLAHLI
ncbi:MAG: glycosyltransferase family 2 protein [Bacteroidaceae bacterium]|nr:glycosyltransferase family 2 protein [Bacteroidaceae bacterium]